MPARSAIGRRPERGPASCGRRRRRSARRCFWLDEGVFDQDQLDALEENLDDGLAEMLCDLQRLTETNMAEDMELSRRRCTPDLILPEDF
jgi:hypothetical protein